MEFQQLVFERRSIRGYKPDPVPRRVLDEIIEVAAQSPSSMNTQPWHVHVVTGDVLDRIRTINTERMLATGKPDREIRGHGRYEGQHRERQKRVAAQLFEAAGIGWDDKAQPQASVGPPAPPKRRLPLAEASFAESESRPIRDQASRGSRRTAGENRGRRVALAALISAALVGSGFFLLPVRDSGGVAPEPQRDADVAPTEDNESAQVPASTQVPAPTATEPALTPTSAPTSPPSSAPTSSLLPTTTLGEPSDDDFAPLLSELAALIGEPASTRPRYDRESFNEGADLDGDCIRTRHEVLIEEATDPVTMSVGGCSVAVGDWYDPFTGRSTADPRDLQVDHVVSLSDAWHSGAWAWSPGQKTEFSNDLSNLNAIWGSENQRKSNLGPSQYVPLNESQTCAYLVQYAEVKVAWRLSITTADYEATAAGLGNCSSSDVGQRPAPASTGTGLPAATTTSLARLEGTLSISGSSQGCHPAYEPCIPNLEGDALNCGDLGADQKPVRVIEPAVDPFRLDGDNDGVGCEGG